MGNVKIEFGSPLILELKLDDGDTTKFVRAIVRDGAGATVVGSPFTLAHVANGRYRNTAYTPAGEGYFTADYEIYNDAGFTQLSNKYSFEYDLFKVDDTEINVQGLRDNYTNVRAANLDNLDATITSRQSEADALSRFNSTNTNIDANETKIDAVQATVDTLQTEADALSRFNALNADLDTLLLRLSAVRAGYLDNLPNLDATVSSRSTQASVDVIDAIVDAILVDTDTTIPGLIAALNDLSIADVQTALTNQGYTAIRAGLLDNLDALISSRSTQVSVDAIDALVTAIKAKTDQITFTGGLVDSIAQTVSDKTGYELTLAERDAIATECEKHMIDELDGQKLLEAIVNAIGNENVDEIALVAAIRVDLERAGGFADQIKTKTDQLSFTSGRVDSNISSAQESSIADKVWDEQIGDHTAVGTTGRSLDLASGGGNSLTPESIADAVWDEQVAGHGSANTFGEKIQTIVNKEDIIESKIDTTNSRLTAVRASKIDNIDVPVSTRQATTDADTKQAELLGVNADIKAVVDGIAATIGQGDPDIPSILGLLTNGTYGLANLRIAIDSRASLAKQVDMEAVLNNVFGIITDGAIGLAILRAKLDDIIAELADADHGLPRLRVELDNKPNSGELNYPTAIQLRDAVWQKLTSDTQPAGSFGQLVKTVLDANISTRATQTSVDVIDGIVDDIKALLENGSYGLAQLLVEINANEAKLDSVLTDIGTHDGNLATARADILAAIGAIVNGTPTILAALDTIKGAGYTEATDSLEAIRDAIGTGMATLGNQTTIISKIDAMQTQNDTVETKVDQTKAEVLANRTQIIDEVNANEVKIDAVDTKTSSVLSQINDVNHGLAKAKTDRDNYKADVISSVGNVGAKADDIETKVDALDAKTDGYQTDLLNAIGNIDTSLTETKLDGVIALLQNGSTGLSAIKQAVLNLAAQENAHHNFNASTLSGLDTKVDSLTGLVTAIQGAGFNASSSLVAIKTAISSVLTNLGDTALKTDVQDVLTELENIKDGGTATFDGSTDSLKEIADKNISLDGVCGGPA